MNGSIPQPKRREKTTQVIVVSIALFLVSYFGSRMLLEGNGLQTWVRVTVALIPVIPFALFLGAFIKALRGEDELNRRIQLEALAVAYPLAILLIVVLGMLELAISLPKEDLSYRHIWPFLTTFYLLGLTLARRRYL